MDDFTSTFAKIQCDIECSLAELATAPTDLPNAAEDLTERTAAIAAHLAAAHRLAGETASRWSVDEAWGSVDAPQPVEVGK